MILWLKKTWSLLLVVVLALVIMGPAARFLGPAFAGIAITLDNLAAVCLVLLILCFTLDNRQEWGLFPSLDLNRAVTLALASSVGSAIVTAAIVAFMFGVIWLSVPRPGDLPATAPAQQGETVG